MPKALPKIVFNISWAIIFAQLVFAISVVAGETLGSYYQILPSEEWSLYIWPLGLWLGWWFANRSLAWHRFNIACLTAGACLTPLCVALAIKYYLRFVALRGTGLLAGLGEAINSTIYSFLGVATLCLFTAGAATTFSGWRFSLRTLLIALTIASATLGLTMATIR